MRIVTYNVNSLKQRLRRLAALVDEHAPDVICVQETKSTPEVFPHEVLGAHGYVAADHSGGRWAGVAVLAREDLGAVDVASGLPGEPEPTEARWVEATVGDVRVVSTYVPNGRELGTEAYRGKLVFLDALVARAQELSAGPAIIAGDLNVCPTDLDVWDPVQVHGGTHISPPERERFDAILNAGFTDAFRTVNPDDSGFTWWDYRGGHFHKGYGLRIDHVLLSEPLATRLSDARVDRSYRKPSKVRESKPSDHAPLIVDLAETH